MKKSLYINKTIKMVVMTLFIPLMMLMVFSCGGEGASDDEVEFIIANGTEPSTIDPHKATGVPEHKIIMALFEGLVRNNPKTTRAEAGVATSWEIDETIYTMHLRKDAVWSDGVAITAETVRDSWLRILNPETASSYAWFPAMLIKGAQAYNSGEGSAEDVAVRVIDTNTFQFETVGPMPYVLDALSHYSFAIVPMHTIKEHGDDWILPEFFVGNGPFVLTEWNPREVLTATKNEKYWDKKNVFIDTIVFIPIDDDNTMFNMYENNEVDWSVNIPQAQIENLEGRADAHISQQLATYYYQFNLENPLFQDINVRKALALSIGREQLTGSVLKGGQKAAYSIVPPMDGYSPIESIKEDDALAKQFLADAGYPNGEGFPDTTVLYNTSEGHKQIAEYIQQRWKDVLNIDINLENKEWKTFLVARRDNDFDIARGGWVGDYLDPNTFLDMFITGGGLNDPAYASTTYDDLINKAAKSEGSARMSILREAETLLINEDVAVIPIYFYVKFNMIDLDKWDGWYSNTLDTHPYVGMKMKK